MLQSHSLTSVLKTTFGAGREQDWSCFLLWSRTLFVPSTKFRFWQINFSSGRVNSWATRVPCENFMGQVYQRPCAALPQEAHSFTTPLPTHTPRLFWVRMEQFIWRWHFSLEHSSWQRCFYATFYWEERKYYRCKRRVEETKQIKEKNLPVGKNFCQP